MATLLEIRDKVRQRADIVSETVRYPDAELNKYINDSYKELYGILTRHNLVRDEASQTISPDGSASYSMPADFFAVLGVFHEENQYYRRLRRHSFRDRPHGASEAIDGDAGTYRVVRVAGTKTIELFPRPSNGTYILSYVPILADLAADTDDLDSALSWDEYIVIDASIKCLRKEGSDTRDLKLDKAEMMDNIVATAEMTEMAEAARVADTRIRGIAGGRRVGFDSADYRWYRGDDGFDY